MNQSEIINKNTLHDVSAFFLKIVTFFFIFIILKDIEITIWIINYRNNM